MDRYLQYNPLNPIYMCSNRLLTVVDRVQVEQHIVGHDFVCFASVPLTGTHQWNDSDYLDRLVILQHFTNKLIELLSDFIYFFLKTEQLLALEVLKSKEKLEVTPSC